MGTTTSPPKVCSVLREAVPPVGSSTLMNSPILVSNGTAVTAQPALEMGAGQAPEGAVEIEEENERADEFHITKKSNTSDAL